MTTYEIFIEKINKEVQMQSFKLKHSKYTRKLVELMKSSRSLDEPITKTIKVSAAYRQSLKDKALFGEIFKYENKNKEDSIVLLRDSYAIPWFNVFSQDFKESYFVNNHNVWKSCSQVLNFISKIKPDYVLLEMVERGIGALSFMNCKNKK